MSASDRILEAYCPESPIDTFEHAARVTEIVSAAHLRAFKRPRFSEPSDDAEACMPAPREETA